MSSPFTGDSPVAVAYQHVREEPMPPTQRNPDVPADLEQIILTAMAKDPDHRYQTADDMRADLLRFRRGRPLSAAPVTALVAEVPGVGAAVGAGAVVAAATMQNPTIPPTDIDGGPPTDNGQDGGRNRALITTLVVLGIIVLVGLGVGIWALSGSGGDQVTVADVVNQPFAEAKAQLEDDGFTVKEERVTNADVAVDIVISQDPAANEKADEGSEVTLTVSAGADTVPVENVDDKSFEDAQRILEDQGFTVQRQDEASSTVDEGRVIRTNPAGGQPAPKNSIVEVFVSTGVEQIEIPDVAGQDSEAAFTTLGDAGFAVREVTESSSSVSSGKVTRTDPPAGTQAPRGATVRMFVSSGAPQVEVPEVRGQTQSDAEATLSNRDLTSSVITKVDDANVGKVVDQSPAGGQRVSPGSNVVLTVAIASSSGTTTTTAAPGP